MESSLQQLTLKCFSLPLQKPAQTELNILTSGVFQLDILILLHYSDFQQRKTKVMGTPPELMHGETSLLQAQGFGALFLLFISFPLPHMNLLQLCRRGSSERHAPTCSTIYRSFYYYWNLQRL